MEELLLKALPTIVSTVSIGLMSWVAHKVHQFMVKLSVLEESQKNQLKAAIVEKYEEVTARGWITPMSLDTVNRMADSYFALGGNHYIHALVSHMNEDMEVRGIPIPKE